MLGQPSRQQPEASTPLLGADITFKPQHQSQLQKSSSQILKPADLEYTNNVQNMFEMSQRLDEEQMDQGMSSSRSSVVDQMNHQSMTKQEIDKNIKYLEKMWEYRYTKLTDYALRTGDWFRLFSFLNQFKEKSISIVKNLINKGLESTKEIDEIDYRYNLKNEGELGIYLIEGIIIRIARIGKSKNQKRFDYNPVKRLHQQFLSYNIINNLSLSLVRDMPKFPRIRAPLTCLVKYVGYTALCQTDTPCDGLQTLVHGPTGIIYQYREEYMDLLRVIGKNLNLKEFNITSSQKKIVSIPFSLTVQLHKITKPIKQQKMISLIDPESVLYPQNGSPLLKNPQYYLMNISKLWPLFIDSDIIKSVGYLRPQVVISYRTPLSNVVFCKISDKIDEEGELELADACKKVKQDYITALAKMLDSTTIFIVDSQGIEDIMHEYGINIRYIGSLASKVTHDFSRKVLEIQMIARACKRHFFTTFHEICQSQKIVGEQMLNLMRDSLIDFLNLIFIKAKEGQKFYRNFIYTQIKNYYHYEMKEYPPLDIAGGGILHAIGYHFGVRFKIIDYPFFQTLENIFNSSHILEIVGSAKTFDMDTTEIKQICKRYKHKRKYNKLDQCIKELKIIAKLNSLISTQRTEPVGPLPQSYFYVELAEVYLSMKDIANATKYAELAIRGIPEKHSDFVRPYRLMIKIHGALKEMNKCSEYYEKSINFLGYHLGSNHPLQIQIYNTLAYESLDQTDASKCQKMFLKSLQICEHSLGYTHATSSQILLQLAELPLPAQKKIGYYLQGLTILQNLQSIQSQKTKSNETCRKISELYEKTGNLDKMIFFAKKSKHWRMQMIGQSKLSQHKNVLVLANRIAQTSEEVVFLITYAFISYIKLLERIPRNNLYKLYVSLKDIDKSMEAATQSISTRLRIDKSTTMTVTEFMRGVITTAILQIPALLTKGKFYLNILGQIESDDRKIKNTVEGFLDIIKIVGDVECEKVLTEIPKKF